MLKEDKYPSPTAWKAYQTAKQTHEHFVESPPVSEIGEEALIYAKRMLEKFELRFKEWFLAGGIEVLGLRVVKPHVPVYERKRSASSGQASLNNQAAFFAALHTLQCRSSEDPVAWRKELSGQVVRNPEHPYFEGRRFGEFLVEHSLVDSQPNTFKLPIRLPFEVKTVLTDPDPNNSKRYTYWTGIKDELVGLPIPTFEGEDLPTYDDN